MFSCTNDYKVLRRMEQGDMTKGKQIFNCLPLLNMRSIFERVSKQETTINVSLRKKKDSQNGEVPIYLKTEKGNNLYMSLSN